MKIFIYILLCSVILGCSQRNLIQSEPLEKESLSIIEGFFDQLKSGDTAALQKLLGSNEYLELSDSVTQDLYFKFSLLKSMSGSLYEEKLINKKIINNDVAAFSYIVKYEKRFYRFTFLFYNNSKKTRIIKFSMDEQIGFELEESLRLYLH